MSTGGKIALALLGLSVAGGLAYYFTSRQGSGSDLLTDPSNAGANNPLVITKSFAEYEGKYVKGSSREVYKVKAGMKELLPMFIWASYTDRAIKVSDTILKSIPTK